jgi:hypothetical protein
LAAIDVIPVAITNAKYPGNNPAIAFRILLFGPGVFCNVEADLSDLQFENSLPPHSAHEKASTVKVFRLALVALFAFELVSEARRSSLFGQHPFSSSERRIVPYVLVMAAVEFCSPMALVVGSVTDYLPLHPATLSRFAGRRPDATKEIS